MKKVIKETYKEWSKTYDDYETNISIIVEKDILIKTLNPQKNDVILDAGCGTGRYIGELKKKSKKIIGIDFSQEMLNIAKEKYPEVDFYKQDLTKKLPFKKNTFNKIVSSLVFPHFKDINKPLEELYRVLKPKGKLIITDFPWHPTINWKSIKYKKKIKHLPDIKKMSKFHSMDEIIDISSKIGFKNKEIIPLRVTSTAKKYLTNKSYEKNKGTWGSVIYILEKEK